MSSDKSPPDTGYKVGRVLKEYDLLALHDRLPELWRGDTGESTSLRELARQINVAVVRRSMQEAGLDPLDGEAENAYRLLTDEQVSTGVRTQQRNRFERDGIDVEVLLSDFVTHQAVHTYLTTALDISKREQSSLSALEKHQQRIRRLQNRTTAVVENSLTDLQTRDDIVLGSADVGVDVTVYCQECERLYDITELLRNGGCECQSELS